MARRTARRSSTTTSKGIHLETPEVQILADEDGFRLHGKSELLVMALPLIDRLMVTRRAAMVHALTVEYKGHGLLMPAWGGTGKTSTMAKLMKSDGFRLHGRRLGISHRGRRPAGLCQADVHQALPPADLPAPVRARPTNRWCRAPLQTDRPDNDAGPPLHHALPAVWRAHPALVARAHDGHPAARLPGGRFSTRRRWRPACLSSAT